MNIEEEKNLLRKLLNDYYLTVGLLRHTADKEFEAYMEEVKSYKGSGKWKMWVKSAEKRSVSHCIADWLKKYNANYPLYKQTIEKIPGEIGRYLMYIKVAVRNYVTNHTKELQDIKSGLMYVTTLYDMVYAAHYNFIKGVLEDYGKVIAKDLKLNLNKFDVGCVLDPLNASIISFFGEIPELNLKAQINALTNKMANPDWINYVIHDAMVATGGYEQALENFDKEEEERERKELGIDKLLEKYGTK